MSNVIGFKSAGQESNSNAIRRLFRDIDGMLDNVEEIAAASRSHSPFNDYLTQLAPEQQRIIEHGISELRTAMICIFRRLGVVTNDPHINTSISIQQIVRKAAVRLAQFEKSGGADSTVQDDSEVVRLFGQMAGVLAHMDRALSAQEEAMQKKAGKP